jgi:hypothetical protein
MPLEGADFVVATVCVGVPMRLGADNRTRTDSWALACVGTLLVRNRATHCPLITAP